MGGKLCETLLTRWGISGFRRVCLPAVLKGLPQGKPRRENNETNSNAAGRVFVRKGLRIVSLLLAVSIIAFALVCASPIDPVQQYILKLGTTVSPERRAALEDTGGSTTHRLNVMSTGFPIC